jgi:hypothetical protein
MAAVALAGVVVAVALQHRARTMLLEENLALRERSQEAARLAQEAADLPRLRAQAAALESLRAQAREGDKLRSEVLRLRAQAREQQQLLEENGRLTAQARAPAGSGPRLAQMPDYLAATNWVDAGFASPADTVQTFFRALRAGDFKRALECATPEEGTRMAHDLESLSDEERAKEIARLRAVFAVQGYRIASQEARGDNEAVISLQVKTGGASHPLTLRRVGNDWKLEL